MNKRKTETNHHRDESDTQTGNDTTSNESTDIRDGSLNGHTNDED